MFYGIFYILYNIKLTVANEMFEERKRSLV